MNFSKKVQVEKNLIKIIAEILPQHFPMKKFGLVNVMNVRIMGGFDSVRVGVSVMRNSHQFDEVAQKVVSKIQAELNHKVARKKVPKIILELDRSGDILDKIAKLEQ